MMTTSGEHERLVGRFLELRTEDGPRYSLVTAETPRFVEYANGGGRQIAGRSAVESLIAQGKVVVR